MKKMITLGCMLLALAGCETEQAKAARIARLTCADSPEGRPLEERQAIADACFRRGTFRKSSGKTW